MGIALRALNSERIVFQSVIFEGMSGNEIDTDTVETLYEQHPLQATIKNWVAGFKSERSEDQVSKTNTA